MDAFSIEPLFDLKKIKLTYKLEQDDIKNYIVLPPIDSIEPKIALVFSGGGARGFSQIGVLECFEDYNIYPYYIIGTSIGAFVGGLYSSGYTAEELQNIVDTTQWEDLFSINDERRDLLYFDQKQIFDRSLLNIRFQNFKFLIPEAISEGGSLKKYLQLLFWNSKYHSNDNYDYLKYVFRPVATDLVSGESIAFKNGNIINNVRASGTFPLWSSPVEIDSMILVDGGLFANIPTEEALRLNPDLIVTVNATSPLLASSDLNKPWNIADQVISVMMKSFSDSSIQSSDFVITPEINNHLNTDFTGLDSLITKGYISAEMIIRDIKQAKDSLLITNIRRVVADLKIRNIIVKDIEIDETLGDEISVQFKQKLKREKITLDEVLRTFYLVLSDNNITINPLVRIDGNGKVFLSIPSIPEIVAITINRNILETESFSDSLTKLYAGRRLTPENFKEISEQIISKFRMAGYPFAFISKVDFIGNILSFNIAGGVIDSVNIENQSNTGDFLVERELKFKKGDYILSDNISKSWDNLMSTDLFTKVNIDIDRSEADTSYNVAISFKDKGNQLISFGAFIDNERYLQAGLSLIQYNLFNTGIRFELRGKGGIRNFFSNASITQQRLLNTLITGKLSAYYSYIRRWTFDRDYDVPPNRFRDTINNESIEEGYGFKASIGFQLKRFGTVQIQYRWERQRHFLDDGVRNPFYTLNTIKFSSIYDNQDKYNFATSGRKIELSLETSLFTSSDNPSFSKLYFSYQGNGNIGRHTIRPRFIFGFADKTLPQNEFFNLGGEVSFFGYREDQMRGRQLALGSLEYEYFMPFKIIFDTYFSIRYDLGSTWPTPETIKLSNLRHGLGMSIGLDTPIGPARFSAGQAFYFTKNPDATSWGYLHLYFSIGVRL